MSSSATDSRGVLRGRCTSCECSGYQGGTERIKCIRCTHPPGKHQNLSLGPTTRAQSYSSSQPTPSGAHLYGGYSSPNANHPPVIRSCGAPDCTDLCYYDPSVGEFDYCSPSCRDKHLLPKEKKALQDDLKAFECQVKQIVLPLTGEKRGTGPPAAGEESEHRSTQASGGRGSCSAAALSSSTQATSPPTGSGRQATFQVVFQKNKSTKDIGLIVSEELYRCDTFSGLLVLGCLYNTKAQYLITTNEVRVLDVITLLNDKEVSPLTYKEEVKISSCTMKLNRSIALPQLKPLMDKAKYFNPTHLIAVLNPKDYPNCSTQKVFGLGVTSLRGITTVSSVTKNSPARFSRLQYEDEIITYGFVKNDVLEIGTKLLSNIDLDLAAIARKTLVLVVKRS